VKSGGVIDDALAQQRPALHQPEHGIPSLVLLGGCGAAGSLLPFLDRPLAGQGLD